MIGAAPFTGQYASSVQIGGGGLVPQGGGADNSATTGNTWFGFLALQARTTGTDNAAFGIATLQTLTTGVANSAFGSAAMQYNQSGSRNVALGRRAMLQNIDGNDNVAVGFDALQANLSGAYNVAVGSEALYSNSAIANVAVGYQALKANLTATGCVAVGATALLNNTVGDYNTAVGVDALYTNLGGYSNTAIGADALGFNTNGFENTALGFNALFANILGQRNTALGFKTLKSNLNGNGNVAIGLFAGAYELGSNTFYLNGFQDRTTTALDKSQSLMYGVFAATPAAQTLAINAGLTVNGQQGINFGAKAISSQQFQLSTTDAANQMQLLFSQQTNASWTIQTIEQGLSFPILNLNTGGGIVQLASAGVVTRALGSLTVAQGFGCNAAAAQAAFVSGGAAPAGGVGTAAGGYDTAVNRDKLITLVNNIRTALVNNGIMS